MAKILNENVDFITWSLTEKKTYAEIAYSLQSRYGIAQGLSVASLKKFCQQNFLTKRIKKVELIKEVCIAVQEVRLLIFYYKLLLQITNFFNFLF